MCLFDLQMGELNVNFLLSFLPILVSLSVLKSALLFPCQMLECPPRSLSMCLLYAYYVHFLPG